MVISQFPDEKLRLWVTGKLTQLLNDNLLGEIMSHNLPILKPSGDLFSLIILYKAAHKWIEISIKSLRGNWKLNHSFLLPHFYLLLGARICNSALKLSYDLMCFSLQFCAGNPEEDFSYYCKWSKWNVACKEKWIVNNWESLVFFENIYHQMKRDFRMSIHFILFVSHPPSSLYSSHTFQIALIHRLILRYFFWVMFINARLYRKIIFACFNTFSSFILFSLMSGLYKSSLIWLSFVRLNTETIIRLNQTSFCFSMIIFFCQNEPGPLAWGFVKK